MEGFRYFLLKHFILFFVIFNLIDYTLTYLLDRSVLFQAKYDASNLCKKVPGKKVSEKKPGNKNFGKKSEFYQVLGKCHWK